MTNDTREEEVFGVWIGRRHYPLSKIGKGLFFAASIAGIVGGCFAYAFQVAGKEMVDIDGKRLSAVLDTATTAVQLGRSNQLALDSVEFRVDRLEEAVTMLAELKCRELVRDKAPYLPPQCPDLMRRGR